VDFIVCEGPNDNIFLQQLFLKELECSKICSYDEVGKLQKIFRLGSDSYYQRKYRWIIYRDNGRTTIQNQVIPRIIKDIHGRHQCFRKFIVLLDDDYIDHKVLVESIHSTIQEKTRDLKYIDIPIDSTRDCFRAISTKDARYYISFIFIFIPKSLEKQIVTKAIEKYSNHFSPSKIKNLGDMDPHEALKDIASKMGVPLNDLISLSINEGWFSDEKWFTTIRDVISSQCDLNAVQEYCNR